jgi:nicotinamidase/pyrazinamidase
MIILAIDPGYERLGIAVIEKVPKGEEVVPVINELLKQFNLVIFTKDWHPARHGGFASQWKDKKPFDTMEVSYQGVPHIEVLWPDHCVQNTPGADIHPGIKFENCKKDFYIFKKGEDYGAQGYSGFEATGLASFLDGQHITEIFVCGLATDYCVKNTAIDGCNQGFDTYVVLDACRGIAEDLTETLNDLNEVGVRLIDSSDLTMIDILK